MPQKGKIPTAIKPYVSHGVMFTEQGDTQWRAECPFCLKEGHFYVNASTGLYDCKVCSAKGNSLKFIETVHSVALSETNHADYIRLKKGRGLPVGTYRSAEMAWNGSQWMIPIRNPATGHLQDIRMCGEDDSKGLKAYQLRSTGGMKVGLWNSHELCIPRKRTWPVWVCEGEWDGMALRYVFQQLKIKTIVVAVPGASTFKKDWIHLFNDRDVTLAYDCDDPGDDGMEKVGTGSIRPDGTVIDPLLAHNIKSVKFVRWPNRMKEGTDLRDIINLHVTLPQKAMNVIDEMVSRRPRRDADRSSHATSDASDTDHGGEHSDVDGDTAKGVPGTRTGKRPRMPKRPKFTQIVKEFSRWVKMSPDMKDGLKISLATVLAAQLEHSDPLWMYLVGPAGCGKTLLTNSLRSCPNTEHRSSLTRTELLSGFNIQPDPSLLAILANRCLVLKDFTELLAQPFQQQEEVFGIMRGAYDGTVRRQFGNRVIRKYDHRFTMLAGCTYHINSINKASMGERCLKYFMAGNNIDLTQDDEEDMDAILESAMDSMGDEKTMQDRIEDMVGAFLDYELDAKAVYAKCPRWAINRIKALAQICGWLRTTVDRNPFSQEVTVRPSTEYGTRLSKQLKKLGCVLAEVSGEEELSEKTYKLVERVAFDTSAGWNLDIVQTFMNCDEGRQALSQTEFAEAADLPKTNVVRRLSDLQELKILRRVPSGETGPRAIRYRYLLNDRLISLWKKSGIMDKSHAKRTLRVRRRRTLTETRGAQK